MITQSTDHSSYHHGDLRAALISAAAAAIERSGYENLSLRELAASVGVSRAAPYRHFADRRALLAAVAANGFDELTAIQRTVIASERTPQARLAAAGRSYLAFAAERPELFRLMFVSDLLSAATGPQPELAKAAGKSYQVLEELVAATLDHSDDGAIKAATIATMSTGYGFALLRLGGRLKPFMYGGVTENELIDTVLSVKFTALPRAAAHGRRAAQQAKRPRHHFSRKT